jgi:hypothetical protein
VLKNDVDAQWTVPGMKDGRWKGETGRRQDDYALINKGIHRMYRYTPHNGDE